MKWLNYFSTYYAVLLENVEVSTQNQMFHYELCRSVYQLCGSISMSFRLRVAQLLSKKCRSGGNTASDLTGPSFESQTCHFGDERATDRPTGCRSSHSFELITYDLHCYFRFKFHGFLLMVKASQCTFSTLNNRQPGNYVNASCEHLFRNLI